MKPGSKPFLRELLAGWLVAMAAGVAAAAQAEPGPRMILSEDGAYVIDRQARQAWPRCVEGMKWDGVTCTGRPLLLHHAQATALAAERSKADGLPWRVPRVTELRRLVNKAARPPGPDPKLFPAAPRDWHWSASVNLDQESVNPYNYGNVMRGRSTDSSGSTAPLLGWAVNLATGEARGDVAKNRDLPVRLVLSLD